MDICQKAATPTTRQPLSHQSKLIFIIDIEERLEIENLMRIIEVTLDYNCVNCLITVD